VKICESVVKILRFFFGFSRWRPTSSWIVEFTKFYWLTVSGVPRHITVPNFVKISRSIGEILRFFEFSRRPLPPSWIFEIAEFYWLLGSIGWRRISLQNFVKISQSVEKTLRYFDFSRWRPPPSCIFEIVNFYLLLVSAGPSRITVPNFVEIGRSVARYCIFSNFQDGRRRHLGFLKSRNFIGYCGPERGEIITVHFAIDRRSVPAVIIIIGGPCNMVDFYHATLC